MRSKTKKVIDHAEKLLSKNKYDSAHDLNHHKRVWNIANEISNNIGKPVKKELLQIACMWHDVLITNQSEQTHHTLNTHKTAEYLKAYMLKSGFTKHDSSITYLAVKHHELDDIQMNTEGKILFDADKLDAFNPQRSAWFAGSKQGKKSLWKLKLLALKNRFIRNYVKKKFHYEHSRKLMDIMIQNLYEK